MISKSNEIYKLSTYRTKLVKYHEIADLLTKVPKCCFIKTKNMVASGLKIRIRNYSRCALGECVLENLGPRVENQGFEKIVFFEISIKFNLLWAINPILLSINI